MDKQDEQSGYLHRPALSEPPDEAAAPHSEGQIEHKYSSGVSIPLAIKWSISISALVVLVMVILGWFLISQQKSSYRHQNELLGEMIVEQFARSASEPLMADDTFHLELLVSQQEKNELIVGMYIFDLDGQKVVSAGPPPETGPLQSAMQAKSTGQSDSRRSFWRHADGDAISFLTPIRFQNTNVGYALLSIDRQPLKQYLKELINALIATTIGLVALGAFLAFPLAHRLFRPIQQLVEVGEAIDRGETNDLVGEQRRDEIGKVLDSFRRMAQGLEKKKTVEKALSRYVAPSVAERILSGSNTQQLGGTTAEGSVLFCDIVGFTELSENLAPEQVANLLNDYFHYFSLISSSCQGTVDKFIGDCIMILFGVPEQDEQHALHAVTCAVMIETIAQQINRQREANNEITVQFRIGINSGSMLAGNVGSEERMQYTVVGDVVNVASRICALASPGGIILTGETVKQPGIQHLVKPVNMKPLQVRGRKLPITSYEIDINAFSDVSLVRENLEEILAGAEHGG